MLVVMVGGASGNWSSVDIGALLGSAAFSSGAALGFDTTPGNFSYSGAIAKPIGLVVLGGNILTLRLAAATATPTERQSTPELSKWGPPARFPAAAPL